MQPPTLLAFLAACALASPAVAAGEVFARIGEVEVPAADFHRFVGYEHRNDESAQDELTSLLQEVVIEHAASRAGVVAAADAISARYRQLDAESRKTTGKGLDAVLAEREVDRGEFMRRLGKTLLVEALARREFELDAGEDVPAEKTNLWLQDRMAKAAIERTPLDPGQVARVDGEPVTLERFGERFLRSLPPASAKRKAMEQQFLETQVVHLEAKERGIELADAELDAELKEREREMRRKPGLEDVDLATVLARSGSSVTLLKQSLRLRTKLLLTRLVREVEFPGPELYLFYRSHQVEFDRLYGEQVELSSIELRAGRAGATSTGFLKRDFATAMADLASLKAEIARGDVTFEKAAFAHSEGSTARQGGAIGLVGAAPPGTPASDDLATIVLAARDRGEVAAGGLIGPLQCSDAARLLRVERFVAKRSFEQLRPEIEKHAATELLRQWMARAVVVRSNP